ncbi:MAG TPA: choline ABC transporter ATP-binding protein [Roseibacterium sp.]|nr:choline ABC transporter ATP-binding protein [Roseibacterium sp.]
MTTAVSFKNVCIMFGPRPIEALKMADAGGTRSEIQTATEHVLGVHDCSLDVEAGEILVLMGLSGSGKSTLLRAVNGLNPVARGQVVVHDGDWSCTLPGAAKADLRYLRQNCVSMVFQQFGLLPWRSVRENVGLGLELAGQNVAARTEAVDRQLALVGLSEWAERKVGELSGGMQQRVGLARAFVTDAPILLMDEPFSALDPLIRSKLQDELLDLQRDLKRTIIFVSHDLDEAFKIGNRIAILEGGRIVQIGTPRQIFSEPATDYVADFVSNMNPLGVLTARDVMLDTPTDVAQSPEITSEIIPATLPVTIPVEMPVKDILTRFAESPAPLAVEEGGTVIGTVTTDSVAARLGAAG